MSNKVDSESGSIKHIINNFTVLLELWDVSLDVVKDSDMNPWIQGVAVQMKFFFGVPL